MQVLVSTTVIEVGVDVPNASLMVIEHAERFGLAQLHQLRGRIGRGSERQRLRAAVHRAAVAHRQGAPARDASRRNDGFEIARRDLEIRGPGEFMGARQSGDALLRFADLAEDAPLLQHAAQRGAAVAADEPAGGARARAALAAAARRTTSRLERDGSQPLRAGERQIKGRRMQSAGAAAA